VKTITVTLGGKPAKVGPLNLGQFLDMLDGETDGKGDTRALFRADANALEASLMSAGATHAEAQVAIKRASLAEFKAAVVAIVKVTLEDTERPSGEAPSP
jgi:hypothetical protein